MSINYDDYDIGCSENELVGKTVLWVESDKKTYVRIVTENEEYAIFHYQDCCESVNIDSINMSFDSENMCEINDVISYVVSNSKSKENRSSDSSHTVTRYVISFNEKPGLILVWEGSSNGYYSEEPQCYKKDRKQTY